MSGMLLEHFRAFEMCFRNNRIYLPVMGLFETSGEMSLCGRQSLPILAATPITTHALVSCHHALIVHYIFVAVFLKDPASLSVCQSK